ncbi:ecdysteroid-regulated 16 kDa protein [Linepithema humile]|uniref:ecdysteroid-regulated 16 kDa protein n=1 Tax=Linepithema humile TaxID=83485 RepID=UPI000623AB8B|nr:PREDICTED: ecdysteroid-regulated 16 kDa protein [Linepithema humile]
MLREAIFVFTAVLALTGATIVNQCETDMPYEDSTQISVSGCEQPVCILKQGSTITIEIKIVPSRTIENLINAVSGVIFNVPLPFIGVDGTSACDNIYNKDGTKVGCPLREGVEYVYKNSFPILPIYPRVAVTVRYALREGNNQVLCFDIPSKITK